MEKINEIHFVNEKIQKAFNNLNDQNLKRFIIRAFEDIEQNPFCGIQISKKKIPKEYLRRYEIKNLWKYNLPEAWRLIYSIEGGTLKIVSIILEWLDHKEYERRFRYN